MPTSYGGGGFTRPNPELDPLSQQLLDAALQHGGAVAQTASEITHPNGGFMSMALSGLGSAFHGLMDTLALPQDAVTSLLSQGTGYSHSFDEVRKQHITPSDVLWGTPEKNSSIAYKVGAGGARFVTDVLLDPVTYLTFGEGTGIKSVFGLNKLVRVPLGPEAAAKLGFGERSLIKTALGTELYKRIALSPEGMEKYKKLTEYFTRNLTKDTLEQFGYDPVKKTVKQGPGVLTIAFAGKKGATLMRADNIAGRISSVVADNMGSDVKGLDATMTTLGSMPSSTFAEYKAIQYLRDLVKEGKLVSKPLGEMSSEELSAWRSAGAAATQQSLADAAETLVRQTISASRGDIEEEAAQAMKNIIENNVKDGKLVDKLGNPLKDQFGNQMIREYAKEFLDKGGIKMFGEAMVSGARIRAGLKLLNPRTYGMLKDGSNAAKAMETVSLFRNFTMSLISTNYNIAGKIPESVQKLIAKRLDLDESNTQQLVSALTTLQRRLKLTNEDSKALSWMLAADVPPATGDGKYLEMYNLFNSKDGVNLAKDIIGGKYGDDTKRMWQAMTSLKNLNDRSLLAAHESGMRVFPQKNYITNLFNAPTNILRPYKALKTSNAVNAEKAEVNKWVNVKDPTKVKYGTETSLELKKYGRAEERARIMKTLTSETAKANNTIQNISKEVTTLWNDIQDKLSSAIMNPAKEIIGETAKDKLNRKALEDVIKNAIPEVDRSRVMNDYLGRAYKDGKKIIQESVMDPEALEKLITKLHAGDEEIGQIAPKLLARLKEFTVTTKPVTKATATKKDDYNKGIESLYKIIMKEGMDGKKAYLKQALESSPIKATSEGMIEQGVAKTGTEVMTGPTEKFNVETLSDILSNLTDQWTKDPGAINKTLESILGRNFEMSTVMEDLADTKRGLEMELKDPGLKLLDGNWFYKDSKGAIYERNRASTAAINQILFKGDEQYVEDAVRQTASGVLNMQRAINSKYLLTDIAKNFGVKQSAAPSNYIRVSMADLKESAPGMTEFLNDNSDMGTFAKSEGEELFYHPTVAHSIVDMMKVMEKDPASNVLLTGYDALTNIWKASVTSLFPMFHGRNALSNVFQNMMTIGYEALNPSTHMLSVQMLWHNNQIDRLAREVADGVNPDSYGKLLDLYKKPMLTDKTGYQWTVGEITRVARDNGIAFDPNIMGVVDSGRTSKSMISSLEEPMFPETSKWMTPKLDKIKDALHVDTLSPFGMGKLYVGNTIEQQARLVNFLYNLKETGNVEHAALLTKQSLFDYQNLTHFERSFMRRIIPFYTFTRKNFELMGQTLIHQPGRVGWFRNGVQNIGDMMAGGDQLSEQERESLPPWMQDGLSLVMKRNGDKVQLLTSLQTPLEQPFQAVANLYGSLNPIIKGPIEKTTGYSFFYGKPLSQVTDATAFNFAPAFLKDYIGFTTVTYKDKLGQPHVMYRSLDPQRMNFIMNMPLIPRVLSTLKAWDQNPPLSPEGLSESLFGVTSSNIDLQSEALARQKEMQTQLEQALTSAGVGYTFSRFQFNK